MLAHLRPLLLELSSLRFLKLLVVISILTFSIAYLRIDTSSLQKSYPFQLLQSWKARPAHPIEDLVAQAFKRKDALLSQRSHDVVNAAQRYRERRGRHPPPGFGAWFEYAMEHDAVLVEEFFDRIYDDLNPFWALEPQELKRRSAPSNWEHIISVRDHVATLKTIGSDPMNRLGLWFPLIQELEKFLPDVDIPMNIMDESRLLVPRDEIDRMMEKEKELRVMAPVAQVHTEYGGLPPLEHEVVEEEHFDPQWITGDPSHYWDLAMESCPADSPSRNVPSIDAEKDPPNMSPQLPTNSVSGFVVNWTLATDPCQQPDLRSLHGTFIESLSVRTSRHLIPLFGGSKLPMNSDILIPAAMYLSTDALYAGDGGPGPEWQEKSDSVIWRGVASGGRNKVTTWTHFHRHRLLQMLNGTAVSHAEARGGVGETFTIPDAQAFGLQELRATNHSLGDWIESFADTAFTYLECFPKEPAPVSHLCPYTNPFFEVKSRVPMSEQYQRKYLIDIDGNSFSGRFRAFLQSTSLPIKATIYSEWQDSRLIPWAHFVPMDSSYVDLYAIMAFFLGQDDSLSGITGKRRMKIVAERDKLAQSIALEGKAWAEQVLRYHDMGLYFWRLLLEWARIFDDDRELLGWVDDLTT